VTKRLCILIVTVCCLVTSTFAQSRQQSPKTNRGILLEISVVQTNDTKSEELDRIEKDKDQLNRLIAEQKLRVISSLRVRTRLGESFSARTGQQVPIQTATLPVYRPIEGARSDRRDSSRSQVLQATGIGVPQIEYKNPGLTVEGNLTKASGSLLDLNLKVELAGMDRSTGNLTPTFTQLSCTGAVRMKESETAVLMNALQPDNRTKSIEEIAAGTEDKTRSSLMVIITTRPVR